MMFRRLSPIWRRNCRRIFPRLAETRRCADKNTIDQHNRIRSRPGCLFPSYMARSGSVLPHCDWFRHDVADDHQQHTHPTHRDTFDAGKSAELLRHGLLRNAAGWQPSHRNIFTLYRRAEHPSDTRTCYTCHSHGLHAVSRQASLETEGEDEDRAVKGRFSGDDGVRSRVNWRVGYRPDTADELSIAMLLYTRACM